MLEVVGRLLQPEDASEAQRGPLQPKQDNRLPS